MFLITLTPFSEKLYTNKIKSDTKFRSNKSSDNFITTNVQKMTVVMHSMLWQKCKQNTFSSLIPPQHGHLLELYHTSSTTEWICLILIWGCYSYIGVFLLYFCWFFFFFSFWLLCERFEESQHKTYTFLMLYGTIFKPEVCSTVDMVLILVMKIWLDSNAWPDTEKWPEVQ